jgi:hypothetical protein
MQNSLFRNVLKYGWPFTFLIYGIFHRATVMILETRYLSSDLSSIIITSPF